MSEQGIVDAFFREYTRGKISARELLRGIQKYPAARTQAVQLIHEQSAIAAASFLETIASYAVRPQFLVVATGNDRINVASYVEIYQQVQTARTAYLRSLDTGESFPMVTAGVCLACERSVVYNPSNRIGTISPIKFWFHAADPTLFRTVLRAPLTVQYGTYADYYMYVGMLCAHCDIRCTTCERSVTANLADLDTALILQTSTCNVCGRNCLTAVQPPKLNLREWKTVSRKLRRSQP